MNDTSIETVILTSVPRTDELHCIKCKIDLKEVQDSSAKSDFHWQTMKCRLIIYVMPEVIASPVPKTNAFIHVVASKEFFKTGKLQASLKEMNVMIVDSGPVTVDVYKACLWYTILFAIAPQWNKVDQLLLYGRNCLTSSEIINGIQSDLFVNDESIGFQLRPLRAKIPFLKLEDLYFPHLPLIDFMADPNGFIDLTVYRSQWVYVLPSMKRGKLISISKEIPKRCPFKTYEELRRHWKNMYGYRLPLSPDGIIYYEIYFYLLRPNYYTYPHMCVRSGPMQLQYIQNHAITSQFLHDLKKKLPRICERPLQITREREAFVVGSYSLDKYLTKANNERISSHSVSKARALLTDALTPCDNVDSSINLTFSTRHANQLRKDVNSFKNQTSNVLFKSDSNLMSPTASLKGNIANLIPSAYRNSPKSEKNYDLSQFAYCKNATCKRERVSIETRVKYDENIDSNQYNCDKCIQKWEMKNDKTNAVRQLRDSIISETSSTFTPCATSLKTNEILETKKYIPIFTPRMFRNEPLQACANNLKVEPMTQSQDSISKFFKEQKPFNAEANAGMYNNDFKRPTYVQDVDIEKMARDNNLERITVSVLKDWLRKHSVPFLAKERKADLIKRIMDNVQKKQHKRWQFMSQFQDEFKDF